MNRDIRIAQQVTKEWRDRNFPVKEPVDLQAESFDQFVGMTEEMGELAHAILKQKQGIRGTHEEHERAAKDAVGDLMIYLLGFCDRRGWDLAEILDDTINEVTKRDWVTNPTGEGY